MGLAFFGLGTFSILGAAALLSVYMFEQVEPAWGRGASAQVMVMLALLGAFVATIAFGVSAAVTRRFPSKRACVGLGAVTASLFTLIVWVTTSVSSNAVAVWWVLPVLPLLALAAPVVLWRRG